MINVCNRVAEWNAARYPREYNHDLAMALLREEYTELKESTEEVDMLDALCDLAYVALGVLWKCNIPNDEFENDELEAITFVEGLVSPHIQPGFLIGAVIDSCELDNEMPVALAMHAIVLLARAQMNLPPALQIEALNIVCDANDLKTATMTDPAVKANIDKGAKFVKPEARLQQLLDECNG
jgi:hypothetical protein